jgi:hypothetical protein
MISKNELALRRIPFSSLKSSTEAFIDYCLPECRPKFNYALIGSGVSQNPNQPVNIREPHGFQLGGVSIPNGKFNTAHMHFTCEVFLCFKGNWLVQWGFNPSCETAEIAELDIISIPTWIYRGFKNVGVDDGFLFTALGGDKTGGVLWGPTTIEAAQKNGVYLTKNHQMFDTTRGETKPPKEELFEPMTTAEIGQLKKWSVAEMSSRIVRFNELKWSKSGLLDCSIPGCGAQVAAVIGLGMAEDVNLHSKITNSHGVSIEWLRIPIGGQVSKHFLNEKQVVICKKSEIQIQLEASDGEYVTTLKGNEDGWDTFSIPSKCWRVFKNIGTEEALLAVLISGDQRKTITWSDDVVRKANELGITKDANGYVAEKRFVERAQ